MKFIDSNHDLWHAAAGEAAADGLGPDAAAGAVVSPSAHLLLDWAQWLSVRGAWPAALPVGLALPNDADVEDIAADLPRFALVALEFPKWVDGRAYSQAHLLRARYRFTGEVRATGEVLVDMLPLLQRTGVDAVVLRGDQSLEAARRALTFVPAHYQGDVVNPLPRFAEARA